MNARLRFVGLVMTMGCCVAAGGVLAQTAGDRVPGNGIFDSATVTATDGRGVYEHVCRGCHMPDGKGAVGAGRYPALAENTTLKSREYLAITLLLGRRNMPAFGARHAIGYVNAPTTLTYEQMAAVVNYVRSSFGNRYRDTITAAEIARLDAGFP